MRTTAISEGSLRVGTGAKRFRTLGALGALTVVALAACGGGNPVAKATTGQAIGNAFSALEAQPGVKFTISLDVTPGQLAQMQKTDGGSGLTKDLASAISATSVVIDVHSGHGESLRQAGSKTSPDKNGQFEISLLVNRDTPVDIRVVNQTLFAKVDAAHLLSSFGQDSGKAAPLTKAASEYNAVVPGISTLAQGGWVSVSLDQFASIARQQAKSGALPPTASLSGSLFKDLGTVFNQNVSFVNAGTHNGRTEYTITAPVRQLAQQLVPMLTKDAGTSASGLSPLVAPVDAGLAKIPAGLKATVQLWVQNNKAQELDFDLNQFDHKYAFPVPLKVVIAEGTAVQAPPGAKAIDLSPIAGLLSRGLAGGVKP